MSIEQQIQDLTKAVNELTAAVKAVSPGTTVNNTVAATPAAPAKRTRTKQSEAAAPAATPAAKPEDDFSLDDAGFDLEGGDGLEDFGLDDGSATQTGSARKERVYTGREAGDVVKIARDVLIEKLGKEAGGKQVQEILRDGKIKNVQSIADTDANNIVFIARRVVHANGLFDAWKQKCSTIYGVEVV